MCATRDIMALPRNRLPLLLIAGLVSCDSQNCANTPTSFGCFQDPYNSPTNKSLPVLSHIAASSSNNMTVPICVSLCCKAGYKAGSIAGVEKGSDCYCGQSFGPYDIPPSKQCDTPCTGNHLQKCGGTNALEAFSIATCSGSGSTRSSTTIPSWTTKAATMQLQRCGAHGCTSCPEEDLCCVGKTPDAYRVEGGYGCSPNTNTSGCASGGDGPNAGLPVGRCCCGPGPSLNTISETLPNVLIVGDSVSAGYTPKVRLSLEQNVTVGHGPNNSGGGNADGVGYGSLCTQYFVRTPQYELPPWDVITFNYGLHDGSDTNASYVAGLVSIANQLVNVSKDVAVTNMSKKSASLIYFATTHSDGGVVPGEPVTPGNQRVLELNELASHIMEARNITYIDLFQTMTECGEICNACNPHCDGKGYQYLVDHAIAPAIKNALSEREK